MPILPIIRDRPEIGSVRTLAKWDRAFPAANIEFPLGVAVDGEGNVIVADLARQHIRKIAANGTVTTLAGTVLGYEDGPGTSARFNCPSDVAVDCEGNIIVADRGNHRIRKVAADGTVTTLAGTGVTGYADGPGTAAQFAAPRGVAVDCEAIVIVADSLNHRIRKIAADGTVTTLAGTGDRGH